ncbi:MAG: hypothetical protein JXQ65_07485 [Candidatus Marinimicrobia bacterium]|nr:hypothetical protein [Candidatus Neomarinimicrobiota bacterium]
MIWFFAISLGLTIFYYFRVKNEPLHPDSAEFIYAGMMQRLGRKKEYFQRKRGDVYQPESLDFGTFPPDPYSSISAEKEHIGSFPYYRDKQFVWWFFEQLFHYCALSAKNFRIINSLLIFLTPNLFFLMVSPFLELHRSVILAVLLQMTFMLPHFDYYQIHAEQWGVLLLLLAALLLDYFPVSFWASVVYGGIIVFVFLFIKITFAPTLVLFFLAPLFVFTQTDYFLVPAISVFMFLVFFLIIFSVTGRLKPLLWTLSPRHLLKYKQGASTSRSHEQRSTQFSFSRFLLNYGFEILLGLLFIGNILLNWQLSGKNLFYLLWVTTALIEILVQGKMYPSHLLLLIVPSFYLLSIKNNYFSWLIYAGIVLLWLRYFGQFNRSLMESYGQKSQNPFLVVMNKYDEVAAYIATHTSKKESITCIGYISPVYVLSNRLSALGFFEAGVTTEPVDLDKKYGVKWHWWLLLAIMEEQPKFIIDARNIINIDEFYGSTGIELIADFFADEITVYRPLYRNQFCHPGNLGEKIFYDSYGGQQ